MRARNLTARRYYSDSGLTMIECLVGVFLFTLIFFAYWMTFKTNGDIWNRGKDKVLLQQACTQASEAMARDIRAGGSIIFTNASDITIRDRNNVNDIRRYHLAGSQLVTGTNTPVVPETCTALTFSVAADQTAVTFLVTLKDRWENKATVRGSAHLRNQS